MGFPRQEYWSELPFLSLGDLPNPGIKPSSPALADRFFSAELPGKPIIIVAIINFPLQSHIENDRFSWAPFSESSGKKKFVSFPLAQVYSIFEGANLIMGIIDLANSLCKGPKLNLLFPALIFLKDILFLFISLTPLGFCCIMSDLIS